MRTTIPAHLTDHELLSEVKRLACREREATAQLIAHLAELDARRLYLAAGFSSLFTYCREALGLSEGEAYNRIEAARAAKRFPTILGLLSAAEVNLTTVRLLAPHLTGENHQELLATATGRSKREVEALLAGRFPRPDVATLIRKLPAAPAREAAPMLSLAPVPAPGPPPVLPPTPPRPLATPLSADRYQIRFTASAATWEKLRLAQDLLRHAVPTGDPAEIVDRALSLLIEDLARKKCAAVQTPSRRGRPTAARSRHVPAKVRRVVWVRDKGRCAFVAASGRRCQERAFLELHHVEPYAVGGQATADNIQLRCRAHNGYEAVLFYGTNGVRREGVVKESGPRYGLSAADSTRSGTSHAPPLRVDGRRWNGAQSHALGAGPVRASEPEDEFGLSASRAGKCAQRHGGGRDPHPILRLEAASDDAAGGDHAADEQWLTHTRLVQRVERGERADDGSPRQGTSDEPPRGTPPETAAHLEAQDPVA